MMGGMMGGGWGGNIDVRHPQHFAHVQLSAPAMASPTALAPALPMAPAMAVQLAVPMLCPIAPPYLLPVADVPPGVFAPPATTGCLPIPLPLMAGSSAAAGRLLHAARARLGLASV